ncbi:uncharacterized protein J8A68_005101 [[Candida] subhashii]|uniref:Tricalbin n=1 Tax=[Candida] subhashii TaxID=561895 RepID=A0A8J5QHS9_9ASCO|nr:uncharacterized protein J8A68_005101 [[Candida] subhashii]KAG7661406.1 hypothetical protein J8A68_005101 [[Candida] subhashii]
MDQAQSKLISEKKKEGQAEAPRIQVSDGNLSNGNTQTNVINGKVEPTEKEEEKPEFIRIRDNTTFSWNNVGSWTIVSAKDKQAILKNSKKVETYIIDHYVVDWYWNCSLMIGTCFFAWFVARWGGGILSLGLVLLFTNSVYRAEFRRFNRNVRDDIARKLAINRLSNESETMEWMNAFLAKVWNIYMPAMSEIVMFQANEILKDQAPGFGIEKLTLDEFTLGSKAPTIDSVTSYTKKGKNIIEMDWAFSFTPNDTDNMTKNEIKKKVDPKVALGVTVGKKFISKSLPILVEDMAMTGRMKVKLRLTETFPHVKIFSFQFLEAPVIDYALKPVGGDTFGIDIMSFIPGLSKFVNGIIHATLRPMFYAPNHYDLDIEELLSWNSFNAVGVVAVTIKRASKLKTGNPTKPNSINPYVQIGVANNAAIDEVTKTKKLINDPIFMETKYILINQLEGNFLKFNVFHLLEDKADDQIIGTCEFPLGELLQNQSQMDINKSITQSGKVVGKLNFDIKYFPTMTPIVYEDGSKETITDAEVGLMKLTLHEARDLDISKSVIGILNPFAEIYVNNELAKSCRHLRDTNEPSWEESFESLITQQSETEIQVLVRDSVDNKVVANLQVNLQDVVFESSRGQEWFECQPVGPDLPTPKIRLAANWKPLAIDEDSGVKTHNNASIGGMRLHIRGAKDLKNLEAVGYVDPYVKVLLNGQLRAKTVTFADTVNPVWNSVYFLPVANEHQHYLLQIMDAEPEGKDRSLGTAAINIQDFLTKDKDGYWMDFDGADKIIEQPVLFNKETIGTIYYSVSFFSTIPAYSLSQLIHKDEYLQHLEEQRQRDRERQEKEEKMYKETPDEFEWMELTDDQANVAPKVEIKLEEAIKHRAGNMVVHLISGRFTKSDVFVHTLFDDHSYPSGVSPRSDGKILRTISSGETFIRDLPNSLLVFRIAKTVEVTNAKDVYAEKVFNTLDIYKKSFSKPIKLDLGDGNSIQVRLEFIPSLAQLAPLDTVLDVGKINMQIIGARNLKAVDSNGKSDPLCVIKLDGVEIHRTDKKRKSLDPEWNESIEFPMKSRSRQVLLVEVYDWDLTHDDELLGVGNLDISRISPLTATPASVKLDTQGEVVLRITFTPEYIRPPLISDSLSVLDLALLGDTGLKAAEDVVGAVGSGVGMATDVVGGGVGTATSVIGGGVDAVGEGLDRATSFIKGFRKPRKSKSKDDGGSISSGSSNGNNGSAGSGTGKIRRESSGPMSKNTLDLTKDEAELRIEQEGTVGGKQAKPNVREADLPSPQRLGVPQHNRGSIDVASSVFAASINGPEAAPGRITVVSASGFETDDPVVVKVTLKTSTKEKQLIKTKHKKLDKEKKNYHWDESVSFRSSAAGEIIFDVKEHHTFGKDVSLGKTSIILSEYVNVSENVTLNAGNGEVVVNIKYFS